MNGGQGLGLYKGYSLSFVHRLCYMGMGFRV